MLDAARATATFPQLKQRMRNELKSEAAAALAELLKNRLPAPLYSRVVDAMRAAKAGRPPLFADDGSALPPPAEPEDLAQPRGRVASPRERAAETIERAMNSTERAAIVAELHRLHAGCEFAWPAPTDPPSPRPSWIAATGCYHRDGDDLAGSP